MAGINDAEFCKKHRAGLIILGGFNADEGATKAAKKAVKRGRREFIFGEPLDAIERELRAIKSRRFAVNVRSSTIDGYLEVANLAERYGGILEINAHCRQPEFISARCGEWLLFNIEELLKIIRAVSKIAIVATKIRGGYALDYEAICKKIFENGCKILHLDAMIPNGGCDFGLIKSVSRLGFVIGNNSFVDINSGERIILSGAKMASAARAVLRDEKFFEKMLESNILSQPVELEL